MHSLVDEKTWLRFFKIWDSVSRSKMPYVKRQVTRHDKGIYYRRRVPLTRGVYVYRVQKGGLSKIIVSNFMGWNFRQFRRKKL